MTSSPERHALVPALLTVTDLVEEGLPAPHTTVVRVLPVHPLTVSLTLTFAARSELDAWAARVDTAHAVEDITSDAWRIGPHRWHVVVGRLAEFAVILETTDVAPDPGITLDLSPEQLARTAVGTEPSR